jgi:pimeloyl-ACP methyl ester carboxylesterase
MATITTRDGTAIFYKDWGAGQPIVFSHGWPKRRLSTSPSPLGEGRGGVPRGAKCYPAKPLPPPAPPQSEEGEVIF